MLFYENGYDAMCMREEHGGELLWLLNMIICGVGGVLLNPMGHRSGFMEEHQEGVEDFSSNTIFKLGDCSKIRFWHDV